MKLLISLNSLELEKYLKFTNSFIIGLSKYSVNYYETTLDEIENILKKYPNIELFVSINKNIFNNDLDDLKCKLSFLAKLKIKGIMFYDISILSFVKNLQLNIPLIIHQDHMITNYNICNYYAEKGVQYAYLSTDITTDEIMEIREKTKINLIIFVAGNIIVTHSKRKLLTNYYQYINSKNKKIDDELSTNLNVNLNTNLNTKLNISNIGVITEKNANDIDKKKQKYYIEETDIGTNILTYQILNGAQAFLKFRDYSNLNNNGISYVVLDSNIKKVDVMNNDTDEKNAGQLFLSLLKLYHLALNKKISDTTFLKETSNILENNGFNGFFNKKTIYKVKK